MYKRLKIKLYPTFKQKQMLDRHFDAYRYCYNLCLEYKSTLWKHHKVNVSGYDMQKEISEIRNETEWLSKCKAECLRNAALNVEKSFHKFFKGNGYPKFKLKKGEQSFHAYKSIHSIGGKIKFFGNLVKYHSSQNYIELLETNRIKQIAFKRDLCGDYWASCLVELPDVEKLPKNNKVVGLDMGISDLIITSDGIKYENKKFLINSHFKLRKLQRQHSKKKKGSNNREKARVKLARHYRKITRQKEWYYHQITNELVRENQTLVIETLRIKNMMRNHKLARNISDTSWGLLMQQLQYKCERYGRELIKVDTFYPSSRTCSSCGNIKKDLKLSERQYICDGCGVCIDRDVNAALNLRKIGLKIPEFKPVENTDIGLVNEAGSNTFIKEGVQFC